MTVQGDAKVSQLTFVTRAPGADYQMNTQFDPFPDREWPHWRLGEDARDLGARQNDPVHPVGDLFGGLLHCVLTCHELVEPRGKTLQAASGRVAL